MEYRQQDKRNSQPDRNKQSKRMVFRRSLVLMLVFGVGLFIPLLAQLWNIAIVHHDEYQAKATRQQLMDVTVSANRGDILDANGEVLAMSATVYNLILAPKDLVASVSENKFKDEDGNLDEEAYNAEIQRKRDEVVDGLCELMPDLDREDLERRMQKVNSQYEVLATQIEEADAKAIRTFIEEHKTSYYLYLTPDTKRYYPFASLASQVLGFVNSEGGAYGLEAGYEDVLKGIPGRVVTGKTGENVEMYNSYSNYIDAINGYDLTLTLDATIQSYAEQMFEAGADLTGRTAEDVFSSDFKAFSRGDVKFGVGQSTYMTDKSRAAAEALVQPFLPEASRREGLPLIFYMFTDVRSATTDLLMAGNGAQRLVETAFGVKVENGMAVLPQVVSRKKQMVPALISAVKRAQEDSVTR